MCDVFPTHGDKHKLTHANTLSAAPAGAFHYLVTLPTSLVCFGWKQMAYLQFGCAALCHLSRSGSKCEKYKSHTVIVGVRRTSIY